MKRGYEGSALVTGASSGIGAEFARQLAAKGMNLTLVARRKEKLDSLAHELAQKFGIKSDSVVCDLSDLSQNNTALQTITERLRAGEFNLLVNNAGRGSFGHFDTLGIEEELALLQLNSLAPAYLASAALKGFLHRGSGGLIFVSSIAAFQPLPYMSSYAASKSVNFFFAQALEQEYKRHNIEVMCVCPGPVDTEFGGVARVPGEFTGAPRNTAAEVVEETLKAWESGKSVVVPCTRAKFLYLLLSVVPGKLRMWIVERILRRSLERKDG